MDQREVVVVGAGFAGLEFAKRFSHPRCKVTILDRTNHHLFQPLLYQVAMAGLAAPDIAQPIRSILARKPRLRVLFDNACSLDFTNRTVKGESSLLKYDYLVLAPGSVTSYFGQDHWKQFAPGLKTLEDALLIRRNVLLAFERAENESDPARQSVLTTIVIVGGGPTGVELAGACAELARRVLKRDFDNVDPAKAKIILIQSGEHVLNQFAPALSINAEKQLRKLGVLVRTGSRVKDIGHERITLETGEVIHAATMVWAAGVQAHPITRTCGADLDKAGRILVEPDLRVPGHPEVFVVGDAAAILQPGGEPVPGVAPAALQMGKHVARLLREELSSPQGSIPRAPFRYKDRGSLATIGRSAGIAQFGRVRFSGFSAWLAWLLVHLIFLVGLRNKISVFISWVYSYLTYKLGARIMVKGDH